MPVTSEPSTEFQFAILAWNMMGGTIDWTALPIICERYGITDIEQLLDDLILIRSGG